MKPSRVRLAPTFALLVLCAGRHAAAQLAKPEVHGSAKLTFIKDHAESITDQQATQYLRLEASKVFSDKIGFTVDTRNRFEYDQTVAGTTRQDAFNLYQAYLSLNKLYAGLSFRVGRQYAYSGETAAQFDGAAAEWQSVRWLTLGAFSGKPVSLMGPALADDYRGCSVKLGAGIKGYLELAALVASYQQQYAADRDVQATVYRRLAPGLDFTGTFSYLNNTPKSASVRVSAYSPEWGLTLTPHYYRHMYVADPGSTALSPYERTLAYTERFDRIGLGLSKYFTRLGLSLGGGSDFTRPDNRQEYYLSVSLNNLFHAGLELSSFLNYSTQDTRRASSYTVSSGYRLGRSLKLSAGTSVSRSQDRAYSDIYGTSMSRTYYSELKWSRGKNLDVALSPSIVRSSAYNSPITRVQLTNGWRF